VIAAIVPAAGRGVRMGRPKLTLPVGGRPMIQRVIAALRDGGADSVVVVTGPHDPAVAPLAIAAGAVVCELPVATPDMRTTVEHGLRWLEERYHPRPDDAWLLCPGDLPLLDETTVRQVCEAYVPGVGPSIIVPTHGGKRGHPALIAWRHVAGIRALPAGVGMDAYLHSRSAEILQQPVMTPDAVIDVDHPEEFERLNAGSLTALPDHDPR